jgi:predicted Zn-dependent protease
MVSGVMMGGFSVAAASGAHLGEVLFGLSYSREDEAEADRVGAALLNRADIRGDGLIDFFTRYQGGAEPKDSQQKAVDSAEEQLLSFLSTHPTGEERIATIRALAHGKSDALTKEQWRALQAICGEPPMKN